MHKYLLAVCLLLPIQLYAEETWQPHRHPAFSERILTGYSEAIYHLHIAAEVNARVLSISVDVGDQIKDQTFIQLDDSLAQIDLELAQAELQQRQASVQVQEKLLQRATSELDYRLKELNRIRQLYKQTASSEQQLDAVTFQHEQAQIAVHQQKAATAQAKQSVTLAEAQVKRSQEIVSRHKITLPSGWTVSKRLVHPQSLVQLGSPLLQLVDTRQLVIRYRLSEQEIAALNQQEKISVTTQLQEQTIDTKIKSISPDFDPLSRKREVVLQADANKFPEASGGITCELAMRLPDKNGGVLIPKQFINKRFDQFRVLNEQQQWIPIHILRYEGDMVVIQGKQIPDTSTLILPAVE